MRGEPLAISFYAEIERTLGDRLRKSRLRKLEEHGENNSNHSNTEPEKEEEVMTKNPPERLLDDYGRTNPPRGRLTIVNQPVNVPNFQLHHTTTRQLEKRPFTRKINEDTKKHLQFFSENEYYYENRGEH